MGAPGRNKFLYWGFMVCGAAGAILFPSILTNEYYVHLANMVGISIILTLSLNLVFGFAGQISVGHAGFYAIGAYVFSNAVVTWGIPFFLSVLIALLACATVGLLIGLPTLRLKGFYLAMATLAFGVVVFVTASQWREFTGGAMGFLGIPRPTVLGYKLATERSYYYLILFSVVIVFWIIHNLRNSDVGRSMVAVRDSESAAGSLGINATKYKLMAFVFASVFAGLAGALYASLARYVSPNNFTLTLSFVILAMVILGGLGSNLGAVLGGMIMVLLPESTHLLGKFHLMVYSLLLILVVIFAPHGLMGLVHKLAPRTAHILMPRQNHGPAFLQESQAILNAPEREVRSFLEVRTLSKFFGGLTALYDVSFSVAHGSITGIIGPNGAGKTTLFNIITGVFPPSQGKVVFRDDPISGLKTHMISHKGIIRTFQSVNLFPDLTVHENVLIGTHRHYTSGVLEAILRLPSLSRKQALAQQITEEVLDITGLNDVRDQLCRNLPFGKQRIVETARALAARPQLILLDEPAAGLASWEKESLKRTLLRIRDLFGITIILIDHSVHFVTDICQHIIVLDSGQLIAQGSPKEIQESSVVQEAYLGKLV